MNTFKLLQSKRKGSTIVLVMIVLVILLLAGAGLLNLGLQSRLAAVRDASEISARCAADAGLAKALYEMNQQLLGGSWSDSNLPYAMYEPLPGCDATYGYTVTPDANDHYNLQAMGHSGRNQKTVSASVGIKGIFEYAVFADDIEFKSGTIVDAYNLVAGDEPLKIGTNSTTAGAITAKLGVTIDGDIAVGVGGDTDVVIDSRAEAAISGVTYSLSMKQQNDNIEVPEWLNSAPSQGTLTTGTTITTSGKYDAINLLADPNKLETIIIDGDVSIYVVGDVRVGNNDEIQVVAAGTNPDASLTLYLGGNFLADNGSAINNLSMDCRSFQMYGLETCTSIQMKQGGSFYGTIYAPNADIQLYNGVEVHGAIVSKTFSQDAAGGLHYDASLRTVSATDVGVRFVVERWSEEQ